MTDEGDAQLAARLATEAGHLLVAGTRRTDPHGRARVAGDGHR